MAVVLYDTVHDVDGVFDLFLNANSILNLCQIYKWCEVNIKIMLY